MSRKLTEHEKAERYERMQARVGLASNVVGITAGVGALGAAVRDPRLKSKDAGPVANAIHRAGKTLVPSPINDRLKRMTKNPKTRRRAAKIGGGLALGAVGLQAANTAGDLVANRVLSREAEMSQIKSAMNFGDGAKTGRRLDKVEKSFSSAVKLANTGPATVRRTHELVSPEAIQQARWARKAAKGKERIASTTPGQRRAEILNRPDLASRYAAVDEARANRIATGSTTGSRIDASAPRRQSQTRSWLRRAAPYAATSAGSVGVWEYAQKSDSPVELGPSSPLDRATPSYARVAKSQRERERRVAQGAAGGAGVVSAGVLANAARKHVRRITEPIGEYDQILTPSGNAQSRVNTVLDDRGRRVRATRGATTSVPVWTVREGAKAPKLAFAIRKPKDAALKAGAALAAGGLGTEALRRSAKKEGRQWR